MRTCREHVDPYSRCLSFLVGQALVCSLFGWLVYWHAFTPWASLSIIFTGVCFSWPTINCFWQSSVARGGQNIGWRWLIPFSALALVLFCVVLPPAVNLTDDSAAYAVFPLKISQTGGLSSEPFSERRLFSLGAHYPLQALVLSFLPLRYLSVIEPGLGSGLTLILVGTLSASKRHLFSARLSLAAGLLLISCLAGSSVLANLAPAFLLLPFFLLLIFAAMQDTAWLRAQNGLLLSALLGVLASCSVALRPTAAPFAGILLLITIGRLSFLSSRFSLRSFTSSGLSAGFGAALFALPFSLDMHRSSGTFLYPFLGRGNHASGRGQAPTITAVLSLSDHLNHLLHEPTTDWLLLLSVIGFVWEIRSCNRARVKRLTLIFSGLLLTYAVIVYQTGGVAAHRYAAPLLISFLLYVITSGSPLSLPAVCKRWHLRGPSLRLRVGLAVAIIALTVGFYPGMAHTLSRKLAAREEALYPPAEEINDYHRLQAAAPAGSVILCTLQRTNLLDIRRNQILLNDQPGMVAPPQEWPFGHGGEYLAQCLNQHQVSYVAVMREAVHASRPSPAEDIQPGWASITGGASRRFYKDLNEVASASTIVYESPRLVLYRIP